MSNRKSKSDQFSKSTISLTGLDYEHESTRTWKIISFKIVKKSNVKIA